MGGPLLALCRTLAQPDVADCPEAWIIRDNEREGLGDTPGRIRRDELGPVRPGARTTVIAVDRACRAVDRVHVSRTVIALERADGNIEFRRAVAIRIDREREPRRTGSRNSRETEAQLIHRIQELAVQIAVLDLNARVLIERVRRSRGVVAGGRIRGRVVVERRDPIRRQRAETVKPSVARARETLQLVPVDIAGAGRAGGHRGRQHRNERGYGCCIDQQSSHRRIAWTGERLPFLSLVCCFGVSATVHLLVTFFIVRIFPFSVSVLRQVSIPSQRKGDDGQSRLRWPQRTGGWWAHFMGGG